MNNFKRPGVFTVSILCLAVGIGVLPNFIRTAGALGRWDDLCAALLLASLAAVVAWLFMVRIGRPQSMASLGWIVPAMLLLAATLACLHRQSLAEAELKKFGIRGEKRQQYNLISESLRKAGVHLDVAERWRHDLQLPPPPLASDEDFEKVAMLLAIQRPAALSLTCGASVQNLAPLGRLKDLIALEIETSSVPDFGSLRELPKLSDLTIRILHIEANARLDFSPLAKLPNLKSLTITAPGAEIDLHNLGQLRRLSITGVFWKELGAQLPDSGLLEGLFIADAPNFAGFATGRTLPNLRSLHLERVPARFTLSSLPEFAPALENLGLDACPSMEDIEVLAKLPRLGALNIRNCPGLVSRLPELKALTIFRVKDSQIASLDEVANAAPNVLDVAIQQQVPQMDVEGIQRLLLLRRIDLFDCAITLRPEHRAIFRGRSQFVLPRAVTRRVPKATVSEGSLPAEEDNRKP